MTIRWYAYKIPSLFTHWIVFMRHKYMPRGSNPSSCETKTCFCYQGSLQWRHNEHDGVSNHQPHDCLINILFRRRSTKTSKLSVTGLCEGNSPVTGVFPFQRYSNAENVCIWWRYHIADYLWTQGARVSHKGIKCFAPKACTLCFVPVAPLINRTTERGSCEPMAGL